MEVERYPADFNGVIASAPAQLPHAVLGWIWDQQAMYPERHSQHPVVRLDQLNLLTQSVLKKCQNMDGVINNPEQCHFNPARDVPICDNDHQIRCFTKQQIKVLEKIYSGPTVRGVQYYPGIVPGAENAVGSWSQ